MKLAPRLSRRRDARVVAAIRGLILAAVFGVLASDAGSVCANGFCSCAYLGGRFLVMTGATIPADSAGIPWSGITPYDDDYKPVLPAPTGFSIERVTPSGRSGVGVELEMITGPLVGAERFSEPVSCRKSRW